MSNKIDFVITWVDGNDSTWIKKKNIYLNPNFTDLDASNKRYRDYGTLLYLLRSIEKYASWVNNIFLVTDHQVPKWLKKNQCLKVIDHTQVIPTRFLPVFNSNVIEWYIDKIPGLSDQFVYFNDDIIFNNPVSPKDFFKNNLPVDFRIYTDIVPLQNFNHIEMNNNILINQYLKNRWPYTKKGIFSLLYKEKNLRNIIFGLQAKKTGIPGYLEGHGPIAFLKQSFKLAKKIWPSEIEENSKHKFRSQEDISIWLIRHLQLEKGIFVPGRYGKNKYCSFNDFDKIQYTLMKGSEKTICINDDKKVDKIDFKKKKINQILNKKFPNKSIFEK